MSLKSGRDQDFQVKKGGMAGLTEKKMGGKAGSENPIVDPLSRHWRMEGQAYV